LTSTLDKYLGGNRDKSLAEKIERMFKVKLSNVQLQAVNLIENTNDNIIVSAPTGSGKTLIAYSALLHSGKGFYLAPLISLMMEKYNEMTRIFSDHTIMVSNRDYRIPAPKFLSADFKIMSPYKFLVLFNEIDPSQHGNVIVVDEIHKMSKDPLFEASIVLAKRKGFRIIGLSATITEDDLQKLSQWLNAKVVRSDNRPVELQYHYIKMKPLTYTITPEENYTFNKKPILSFGDTIFDREQAAAIVASKIYLYSNKPVIVWSPTRRNVERIAKMIAEELPEKPEFLSVSSILPASNPSEKLLKFTASRGVFIHHGGLSANARAIVEREYRKHGGIIVTAYTLSHGVNIPGTYLIFSTIYDENKQVISPSLFHQIAGRAGRPGFDDKGVIITILVGDSEESYYFNVLLKSNASEITPLLLDSPYSAVKMLLPVVSKGGMSAAINVLKDSFSYLKNPDDEAVKETISLLEDVIKYYDIIGGKEAQVSMDMGLLPIEYEIIQTALSKEYHEALSEIIQKASSIYGIEPSAVANDILKYGYLATWMGKAEAREVANTIQTILETGVFYASRVFGWDSVERKHMSKIAKMFTYAGNPLVEPLAKTVRIDTLRRMIKAAPQIVEGASDFEDAYNSTIVAVKEAFYMRKTIKPKAVKKIATLVWYAMTGSETPPSDLIIDVLKEVRRR